MMRKKKEKKLLMKLGHKMIPICLKMMAKKVKMKMRKEKINAIPMMMIVNCTVRMMMMQNVKSKLTELKQINLGNKVRSKVSVVR